MKQLPTLADVAPSQFSPPYKNKFLLVKRNPGRTFYWSLKTWAVEVNAYIVILQILFTLTYTKIQWSGGWEKKAEPFIGFAKCARKNTQHSLQNVITKWASVFYFSNSQEIWHFAQYGFLLKLKSCILPPFECTSYRKSPSSVHSSITRVQLSVDFSSRIIR